MQKPWTAVLGGGEVSNIANIAVPANGGGGVWLMVTVKAGNGTDRRIVTYSILFSVVRGGTNPVLASSIDVTPRDADNVPNASVASTDESDDLSAAFSISSGTTAHLQVRVYSALAGAAYSVTWFGQAIGGVTLS